jgi:hypothetical protein
MFSLLNQHSDVLPEFHATLVLREISGVYSIALARLPFLKRMAHLPPLIEGLITPGPEIASLLPVWRPSALASILRRLIALTRKASYVRQLDPPLDDVLTECSLHRRSIGISFLLSEFVRKLFRAPPAFTDSRATVAGRYFADVLIRPSHPAFLTLCGTLPYLMREVDRGSNFYDKLVEASGFLGTHWFSLEIFLVYAECLDVRLKALHNEKHRAEALMKTVNGFFHVHAELDCYDFENCLDAWLRLMRKYLTFEQSSDLIVRLFLRKRRRFFPAFVELARTTRAILRSPNEKMIAGLPKLLEMAEAAVERPEHKQAVRLLATSEAMRDAIQLTTA